MSNGARQYGTHEADYWQKVLAVVMWRFTGSNTLKITPEDIRRFEVTHPEEPIMIMTHDQDDDSVNLLIGNVGDARKMMVDKASGR